MAEDRWLTVQDVVDRLGAHEETVRRWIRSGKLKASLPGGNRLGYRIRESELARFMERGEAIAAA